MSKNEVYSEYEMHNVSIRFREEASASKFGCLGSCEETMGVKVVTKQCEGVTSYTRTKPDGTGELKISMHMAWEAFKRAYALSNIGLKEGVYGYGALPHEEFCMSSGITDEEDNKKLKAYPRCVISSGKGTKIENGADTIAEVELTISVFADEYGFVSYEALEEEITDENLKSEWFTNFSPDLVRKKEDI